MGRVIGVVFCCFLLFWVLTFLTPTEQRARVNNFCAPFRYPVQVVGAAVSAFNEDGGQSISNEGTEATNEWCRDFAPRFLNIFGAGKESNTTDANTVSQQKQEIIEQMKFLDSPEGKAKFSEEEIKKIKASLVDEYRSLEQSQPKNKTNENGISEQDKL